MKVIQGDNIETLKKYPDNYFDAVVTDPPYGLGKEPDAVELMKDWIDHGYHEISGSGFMGKDWDAFVPQPLFWKEVFRVLKHGGHVLAFYGTRTFDWGVMAMRFAGFEVRDTIYWHYGNGFPKSHNIGKAIDKLEGNERIDLGKHPNSRETLGDIQICKKNGSGRLTKGNSDWEGWGSALKPASEPIVLARKPLEKGLSIAENVMKWGTGGINIDGCRVSLSKGDDPRLGGNGKWHTSNMAKNVYGDYRGSEIESSSLGRFPANLIMTHHHECECRGLKKVKGVTGGKNDIIVESKFGQVSDIPQKPFDYADENGEETIEDWNCHLDCPIRIMDEQSGIKKSGKVKSDKVAYEGESNTTFVRGVSNSMNQHGDSGGASRFFYCAKASKSERNKGLEGFEEKENKHSTYGIHSDEGLLHNGRNPENRSRTMSNFHPTVKPVKLMQYLVRLITPPNGKVLDPFCGSGTTGIACKIEGFEFVGLEQDAEYCKIAEARIKNYQEEKEESPLLKEDKNTNDSQLSLF